MSPISCKRLFIILINICLLSTFSKAQDSSVISHPPAKVSSPAKPNGEHPKVAAPAKVNAEHPKAEETVLSAQPVVASAVKAVPKVVTDMSIQGQYDDLLKHSWMQQGYKVVNASRLTALWNTITDSLNHSKKLLADAKSKLAEQAKQIGHIDGTNTADSTSAASKQGILVNEISFLGMPVSTSTYNWIVWGLITVLAVALAGILFMTTKNSLNAKEHKQLYDEITAEYHTYKTKAKEKELKLARELQTERNTIEELLEKKKEEGTNKK